MMVLSVLTIVVLWACTGVFLLGCMDRVDVEQWMPWVAVICAPIAFLVFLGALSYSLGIRMGYFLDTPE